MGAKSKVFCAPGGVLHRGSVLACLVIMRIAVNILFDIPAGLESVFIEVVRIDSIQYNLLYSFYSWPNFVAAIIGGFMVDGCLGRRLSLIFFLVVACVGQATLVVGTFFRTFWIMGLGRVFIGIGCELSLVIGNVFLTHLFKGKEVNFAFGMDAIASRTGGTIALYSLYPLYNWFSFLGTSIVRLTAIMVVGFMAILLATIIIIAVAILDKKMELAGGTCVKEPTKKFAFRDILKFSFPLWLILFILAIPFAVFFSSVSIGEVFFTSKYGMGIESANTANMVAYIVNLPTPLLGILMDKIGYSVYWGISGVLSIMVAQVLFASHASASYVPYIGSALSGVCYAILSTSLTSAIGLIVSPQLLGTAYGLTSCLQNISAGLVSLTAGLIIDHLGYFVVHIFYLMYLGFALSGIFLLLFTVGHNVHKANMSSSKLRRLEQAQQHGSNSFVSDNASDEETQNLLSHRVNSQEYLVIQQFGNIN